MKRRTCRILLASAFWVVSGLFLWLLLRVSPQPLPASSPSPQCGDSAPPSSASPGVPLSSDAFRPVAFSPPRRRDGQSVQPVEGLLSWGLDSRPPSMGLRRCRFATGSGDMVWDYSWGEEIPESEPVEDDFFSDSVFIGNSLEQGFQIYSGLETPDYFATQSITFVNIYYEKAILQEDQSNITILDALAKKSYQKVYVMLGLNEIVLQKDAFSRLFGELIDRIRELQPEAAIYLQSISPVSAQQSASGTQFNNQRIRAYNLLIQELAKEKQAHFLNIYEALANEDGDLPANTSFDGIHPYRSTYQKWLAYLRAHTLVEVRK